MFNFGLYKEGIRRTRVFGAMVLACMFIGAILVPVVQLYHHNFNYRSQWEPYQSWFNPILTIRGGEVVTIMAVAAIIATPLVILSVFSFLNNRNSSDFYHAIPHKRETLFTSFLAAALTWTIGAMWVTSMISTIIYAVSPHTNVYFGSILIVLVGFTAVILLITGGVALAMTFTGTVFSNIATAGLILFFPRGMMAFYTAMVADGAGIISATDFGMISDHSRNLIFITTTSGSGTLEEQIIHGLLYTSVLAIGYLLTARYLFKKRHSEVATHAGTKWSQSITRVIVAFIITIPVLAMILAEGIRFVEPLALIVLGAITIITYYVYYYVYEFITARKVPSLLHASKGLGMVLVLNLLFIGAVTININMILREVDSTRVTSVQIADNPNAWSISYAHFHQYHLEITDLESVTLLAEILNEQIELRRHERRFSHGHWWSRNVRLTFTMENGRTITRNLRIQTSDSDDPLQNFFRNYEPYLATYLLVPEQFEEVGSWPGLTRSQYERILVVLREELQTVDIEEWYEHVGRFSTAHNQGWIYDDETGEWYDPWQAWRDEVRHEISIHGFVNGQRFWSNFPLTERLTPRTLALYRYYLE